MGKWVSCAQISDRLKIEPVGTYLILGGQYATPQVWHKFDGDSWRNAKDGASQIWWSMKDSETMAQIVYQYFGIPWSLS